MKKLSKKGFSLVELMIVVVILGILIAVAIPVYDAIVENAREKTCKSNQQEVRSVFTKYILMDGEHNADTLFLTSTKEFDGSKDNETAVLAPEFLNFFENGTLPACPDKDHHYVIKKVDDVTISVQCFKGNKVDEDHAQEPEDGN